MAVENTKDGSELPIGRSLEWFEECPWRLEGCRGLEVQTEVMAGERERGRGLMEQRRRRFGMSEPAQNTLEVHIECVARQSMPFKE